MRNNHNRGQCLPSTALRSAAGGGDKYNKSNNNENDKD
jgi:hypothetical protein